MTLTPEIGFFCKFELLHTIQEQIAPKWLAVDQDNLHNKFLALNIDFSNLSLDPLRSTRPADRVPYRGAPTKNGYFSAIGFNDCVA